MKRIANQILGKFGLRLSRADSIERLENEVRWLRERYWSAQEVVPDVYGHAMYVDPNDAGVRLGPLRGAEPTTGEARFIVRNVRAGQTAVDLGANIGLFTLLMARQVGPSGKVIAIEPGPRSFDLLQKNIAANGYRNVVAEQAAVADISGRVNLLVCRSGESDNRILPDDVAPAGEIILPVRAIALDDYLADEPIHFIKIDVQGAETRTLKGMQKTIAANPGLIVVMEYAPAAVPSPPEFLVWLRSLGFSIARLDENDTEERLVSDRQVLDTVGRGCGSEQTTLVLRR